MKKTVSILVSLTILLFLSQAALAHFQMIYTPETALEKGKPIDLKLVFTHPFDAGHTMNMSAVKEFYSIHKGKKSDLLKTLNPITWTSLTNKGKAYETSSKLRGIGDWVFVLVPGPYHEEEEGIYIQQITKMVVNAGGLPTDWDAEIGLPTEIVPLDKPYALWTGNVFRGIVVSNGKPVPFAELEVEYLNHTPIMDTNSFLESAKAQAPQDSFVTLGIKANAFGEFSFGIPKAGWWGFCALGSGPDKEFNGKELSQDAVIWVQAVDMD